MRKLVVLAVGVAALGLATTAGSRVTPDHFTAHMNAAQEVPKQAVPAMAGTGTFTSSILGRDMSWRLTFSHLSGPALAAHIHVGKVGAAGAIIVPLCAPCKSGVHKTLALTPPQLSAIGKGNTYVNVHTKKNPAGEIRGQLKPAM